MNRKSCSFNRKKKNLQLNLELLQSNFNQRFQAIISKVVQTYKQNFASDQQVRHLIRDGWNVENNQKGEHRLLDVESLMKLFC